MEKLKIAVQKSGRLSEKSIQLLQECNIKLTNGNRKLISVSSNFPIEILYLRDDDIPQYIYDGVADIGIVGENEMLEKNYPLNVYQRLGFAKCRLSLAIPKSENYESLTYFQNKKIATSYPSILQSFLEKNNIDAEIHQISGSVEISPSIGLADAIFDIVSSGSTLISNGLKEVEQVIESEAVMIGKEKLKPEKQNILDQLIFRIKAVQKAKSNKYILLNAPNEKLKEIIEIIPGMKSPTIMPLVDDNWCSLHSVVNEEKFWEVIDRLKSAGAQGILVIPIEKMIL
ncbi:MAG: ATP phosphoribosyltransferase [Thiohalospira sp.]